MDTLILNIMQALSAHYPGEPREIRVTNPDATSPGIVLLTVEVNGSPVFISQPSPASAAMQEVLRALVDAIKSRHAERRAAADAAAAERARAWREEEARRVADEEALRRNEEALAAQLAAPLA